MSIQRLFYVGESGTIWGGDALPLTQGDPYIVLGFLGVGNSSIVIVKKDGTIEEFPYIEEHWKPYDLME